MKIKPPLSELEQLLFVLLGIQVQDMDFQGLVFGEAVDIKPENLAVLRAAADLLNGVPRRALERLQEVELQDLHPMVRQLYPGIEDKARQKLKEEREQLETEDQ